VKKKAAAPQKPRDSRLSIQLMTEEDRDVVRAAKSHVARRGILLRDYVLELLRQDLKGK
jgi:hypothetical protein